MKFILILLLIVSQPAFADTAINVSKGEIVPYEGTLMDKERSKKIRDELIDKDALEKTNESLNKSILLYKANEEQYMGQKKLLVDQNIELTKVLNDTRETSGWLKVGYFVLGMAVTGLAVYGATKLAK